MLCSLLFPQTVEVLGLSIAGGCGLFLLGNYGVQGDFSNDAEEWVFISVMVAGGASLLITAVWQGLVIQGEIRNDEENAAAGVGEDQGPTQQGAQAQQDPPVTELATAFVSLGVLATTAQVGFVIAEVSIGDVYFATAAYALLPIVGVLYLGSFFAKPKRQDRETMLFLRAHFISFAWLGEGVYMFWGIREGDVGTALIHLGRALLQTLGFHYLLKLRASIGRLPDKDLNNLLVEGGSESGSSSSSTSVSSSMMSFPLPSSEGCLRDVLAGSFEAGGLRSSSSTSSSPPPFLGDRLQGGEVGVEVACFFCSPPPLFAFFLRAGPVSFLRGPGRCELRATAIPTLSGRRVDFFWGAGGGGFFMAGGLLSP